MANKKILFVINGLGLGNSTRCHAIISQIKSHQGLQIDILANQHSYKYFNDLANSGLYTNLYQSGPLSYGKDSKLGFLSFIKVFFSNLQQLYRNGLQVKALIKQHNYDLIITDSDYSVIFWKHLAPTTLGINNSAWVTKTNPFSILKHPNLLFHYAIEILDFVFHRIFLDKILNPTMAKEKNRLNHKVIDISPPVRLFSHPMLPAKDRLHVLILTSISNMEAIPLHLLESFSSQASITVVGGPKDEQPVNTSIQFIANSADIGSAFSSADIIVTNAGLSTISEILHYNKTGVLVPIQNHAEQYANAKAASEHVGVITAKKETLAEVLKGLLESPPPSINRGLENGSQQAAAIIFQNLNIEESLP